MTFIRYFLIGLGLYLGLWAGSRLVNWDFHLPVAYSHSQFYQHLHDN